MSTSFPFWSAGLNTGNERLVRYGAPRKVIEEAFSVCICVCVCMFVYVYVCERL